jgi:hypothetical protein
LSERADRLFDSSELAEHIADTLVDHRLVSESGRARAVESIKWELDVQVGMGRVVLRGPG